MLSKKHQTTGSNDLFRARLDQIINMKDELKSSTAPSLSDMFLKNGERFKRRMKVGAQVNRDRVKVD